ncbi:GNAT family N-acetyltransferase [Croceivirga radicis]|uniref:GNAT family N-acetyltransferase n=1 Tax=Croceivirga radicis TaxID=1929488 RepID=UPI0002E97BC9|nr:GNAT family N-acetyltransferase [Croceivirga radicis]
MQKILNILSNHMDFHELVLLEKRADKVYRSISNSFTGNLLYQKTFLRESATNYNGKSPIVLTSVPSYINTELELGTNIAIKKVKTFPGSLIKLSAYKNYDDYLKKNFDQKGRSHFAKCRSLLDECFNIRHQVFYGSIEEEEYQIVFDAFEQMQARRFKQKGLQSGTDPMLSEYREKTLELVRNKQACISVIYNGARPIALSLNYTLGKIVFGFTKTFDPAYSKFSLGNIELLNIISWSFDKGFEVLDIMKGEYSYKNRFADTPYTFLIETIYHKDVFVPRVWGYSIFLGFKLFYFIYQATRFVKLAYTKRAKNIPKNTVEVQIITMDNATLGINGKRIYFDEISSQHIQRAICDYCYRNKQPMETLKFYKKEGYIQMISDKEILKFNNL